MEYILSTLGNLVHQTAFFNLTWGNYLMILVALFFMYLAIKKEYEPLLLVPISFGMLLVNLFPDIMLSIEDSSNGVGGLLHYFYLLDEWSILPSLIFLCIICLHIIHKQPIIILIFTSININPNFTHFNLTINNFINNFQCFSII